MEKQTQTGTPEPAAETGFGFPPRRKSPLKSETYRTLLKIFSLCQDLPEKAAQEQRPDDYGADESGKASDKDAPALTVLDDSLAQRDAAVDGICEDIGCKENRGLTETQVAIDGIDNMMGMEVDEEFLKQSKPMVGDYGKEQGLGDKGFDQAQQLLMDELQHAIKGNQELVNNSNCNIFGNEVAEENRSAAAVDGVVFGNQEKRTVLQPVGMGEFRSAGQQLVREEHHEQNVSKIFNSPMDKSVAGEVSNPGGGCKGKSSLESAGELGILYERSQKKFELEKPFSTTSTVTSSSHMIENGEREEGEISGLLEVDDRSAVMSLEEGEFLEDKRISEHVTDGNLPPMNEKSKSNVVGSDSLEGNRFDNANYSREAVAKESARIDNVCKRKIVTYEDPLLADEAPRFKNRKISHEASEQMAGNGDKKQESKRKRKKRKDGGSTEEKKGKGHKEQEKSTGVREQEKLAKDEIGHPITITRLMDLDAESADQNATGSQSIASEKKNADICNNSKRGGSKESKKMKKRKKRAERNRELGVKRLKLRPVLIPKPVVHCRHYLKGRCHEGEKCKFSHDVVPLTKSQPCCHFARHSCMKGENCPFDHQLSKYPCSNYATKGFCIRGESCMFSHKVPSRK
ncbi:hypothetical protein Tsubulata_003226 [Turnera subulata]|uniref:C3H1-type domain-containing protein n=1 Tax=Turnera subulata TaxID=218843 RepID=A0A9Q0JR90_9ROSI|nr:hypothetical protein Tsubulata_003226 [Turnera subulata]